jgi:hypothetical protein
LERQGALGFENSDDVDDLAELYVRSAGMATRPFAQRGRQAAPTSTTMAAGRARLKRKVLRG